MHVIGDMPGCKGPKAATELSMHQLSEDGCIVGNPEEFERVDIPDNTKLEHINFVALGHSSSEPLALEKYQIDETSHYCVEASENKGVYLLVKQLPESLKDKNPTFIVEPRGDFFTTTKKRKVKFITDCRKPRKLTDES